MESLAEIITRVERLAFAGEGAQQTTPDVVLSASPSSDEQSLIPLAVSQAEVFLPPEYIQAEAFLEVSGYFTPSSKRIKSNLHQREEDTRICRCAGHEAHDQNQDQCEPRAWLTHYL
jgi:hypothetical protein